MIQKTIPDILMQKYNDTLEIYSNCDHSVRLLLVSPNIYKKEFSAELTLLLHRLLVLHILLLMLYSENVSKMQFSLCTVMLGSLIHSQ